MSIEALPADWDAVVVGAGIAGSVSALRLARGGLRVLLVESAQWPRDKVCGGCVNAAALRALAAIGLTDVAAAGRGYTRMRLAVGRRQAWLPLPAGRAIARRRLDVLLAAHAVDAGARFLPATRAALGDVNSRGRKVVLRRGVQCATVNAQLVLDCGGLGSRLLPASVPSEIAPGAYIGLGASLSGAPEFYAPGVIHMACGEYGYVGLVAVERDRINVGAALAPDRVKREGGPAQAIAGLLDGAAFPLFDSLREARWHGTPRLTRRRRRLGAERVLVLGDAAGYVEPFTGEGMAWALADAAAVQPFVHAAAAHWQDELVDQWSARHAGIIRNRQRVCRGISALLRRPRLLAACLPFIAAAPAMVSPLTTWLNHDFKLETAVDK